MATNSFLEIIAEQLGKLVLKLASEELKDKLQEPTSQQLLLRLNKIFFQLDLESQLFVSRLGQLVDGLNELGDEEPEMKGAYSPAFDAVVNAVRESIRDIGKTIDRISLIMKQFAPILDIYDNELFDMLSKATITRSGVISDTGIVLTELANDRSMSLVLISSFLISPASLKDLRVSFANAKSALRLVHQVRLDIRGFVRKTYPSIKDLPE